LEKVLWLAMEGLTLRVFALTIGATRLKTLPP